MKLRNSILILLVALLSIISTARLKAETRVNNEDAKVDISVNADLVSRYVWRGMLYSSNFNLQPSVNFGYKNFYGGVWGSYGIAHEFAEVDFYVGFTKGNFAFTLNDYYVGTDIGLLGDDYFNYSSETTNHAFEAEVQYFFEDIPLVLTGSNFFYGNDRDEDGDNYYSTYFEAMYNFYDVSGYNVSLFAGGTPAEGLYSDGAAIVNVGASFLKEVEVNDLISLPLEASLIFNPDAEDIFFVLSLTF
ncbi:hypothetical protein QA597_09450 [Marinilabiliaceae bacterium ANBcel2]|nr:hypothetical protein [Marinilabiliaceae bacterium ANBcel2]